MNIPDEVIEKVARSMMDTVFHQIDVATAPLDWTGNDVWGCDFAEMSRVAITATIESRWVVEKSLFDEMVKFVERIGDVNGGYPYLDGKSIVADSRAVLNSLTKQGG